MMHKLAEIAVNNRGQSLIESALLLPILIPLVTLVLGSLYFLLATQWADYWVYKTAVCLAENQTERQCKSILETQVNLLIPQTHFSVMKVWKTKQRITVSAKMQITLLPNHTFHLEKHFYSQISLPLRSTTIPNF